MNSEDTFTFYKDKSDKWRWRRRASNGRIVGASSEGFVRKIDCLNNAIRNGYKVKEMKTQPTPIDTNPYFRPQKESLIIRIIRYIIAKFSKR